jgi:hypothetical protein
MNWVLGAVEWINNPIVVGLILSLPASYFGWKAKQRAEAADASVALTNAYSLQGDAVQQAFDGLNEIIRNLRELRVDDRKDIEELEEKLAECREQFGRYATPGS